MLGSNSQSDVAAFLAGYTAALTTDDYRIGMMMPKDNPDAMRALNAYANGMKYYCGICRPVYFFAWAFPQYVEIPAEEDQDQLRCLRRYFDPAVQGAARFIFIRILSSPDLATYIGTTGTSMIGTITPEQRPAGWVMTIQPDIIKAIQNAWPDLVSGKGGITVQSPLGPERHRPQPSLPGKTAPG